MHHNVLMNEIPSNKGYNPLAPVPQAQQVGVSVQSFQPIPFQLETEAPPTAISPLLTVPYPYFWIFIGNVRVLLVLLFVVKCTAGRSGRVC